MTLADYSAGPTLTGTLPDGTTYSVPTFVANGAKVVAGGGGFLTTTVPGYSTDYHGVEVALVKRLSQRWMGARRRVLQQRPRALQHRAAGRYDTNGNPTPTVNEPLVDGGQFAPSSSASSGSGSVYINARWQFNANAMYQSRRSASKSAATCSAGRATRSRCSDRRRSAASRCRSWSRRRSTTSGTTTCGTRTCAPSKAFKRPEARRCASIGDLFNVFNANTVLVRNNNILATTFNQIAQNLSPRIFRVGVQVGF